MSSQPVEKPQTPAVGNTTVFDVQKIKTLLPHRYPFLLIDRVVEFEDGKRIVAIKNVTANEEFFSGHFPEYPVMPGVLVLEAAAQAGCILARASTSAVDQSKTMFLVGADNFKWKKQVVPGDQLRLELVFVKHRRPLWIMEATVTVDGKVVACGNITAAEA